MSTIHTVQILRSCTRFLLQCVKVLTQVISDYPKVTPKLRASCALLLASHFVVSYYPRDVVPRVFRLSQTLCVVSVHRAVPKPWTRHCPHSVSRLLRSVAKSSETSCCKLLRISPQDGPVGSSKDLCPRQCVTSNVHTVLLDVCSDHAHSTRAIVPKLRWTDAVRQGNKFPRREVKQTRRLSDMTDVGVG